ncbi:uncharacterized protein [Drosophila pseudoobscura]|uniref:Uncharacterized protein isoform X1 n=1 Tax=Drosophila pseudoobscura pseudoobscura TaxID=46245 RepID=A0A6I8VQJ1_DROPS|nr:uncharacterized protein LOC6897181 isoform X1 [Drosophila pseudoobscura]XP_033233149.1 uncharacterized protein LOC6897181 isoform X1 [Drosophila pseudoobscura]XP_033233150.1 uncharacterized protein LOC6897181 isoform X1 [Drosophila pseudoobscura]
MDVSTSTSTSFESSNATMDNNSSSDTGDTTLYGSALDNLSATAYGSCNDITESSKMGLRFELSDNQIDRIYHENPHVCRPPSVTKSQKHELCMRWLNASYNSFDSSNCAQHHLMTDPDRTHEDIKAAFTETATKPGSVLLQKDHKLGIKHPQLERYIPRLENRLTTPKHLEAAFIKPIKTKADKKTDAIKPGPMVSDNRNTHEHMEASQMQPTKLKSPKKKPTSPCSLATKNHNLGMKHPQLELQKTDGHVQPPKLKSPKKKPTSPCSLTTKNHNLGMKHPQLELQKTDGHVQPPKLKSPKKKPTSPCSLTTKNHNLGMKQPQLECHKPILKEPATTREHTDLAKFKVIQKANPDPITLQMHHKLKLEHEELVRQIDTIKLNVTVLQIETNHMENKLRHLAQERELKGSFTDETKANLFAEATKALEAQTAETFPTQFLSEIFSTVAGEEELKDHFSNLDHELRAIVEKLCVDVYQLKKPTETKTVNRKIEALKAKLSKKYQKQINREEKSYKKRVAAMKEKCFDMLQQFLKINNRDTYSKVFLKELKALYEQDTQSF